jgi:hypothetical protein
MNNMLKVLALMRFRVLPCSAVRIEATVAANFAVVTAASFYLHQPV